MATLTDTIIQAVTGGIGFKMGSGGNPLRGYGTAYQTDSAGDSSLTFRMNVKDSGKPGSSRGGINIELSSLTILDDVGSDITPATNVEKLLLVNSIVNFNAGGGGGVPSFPFTPVSFMGLGTSLDIVNEQSIDFGPDKTTEYLDWTRSTLQFEVIKALNSIEASLQINTNRPSGGGSDELNYFLQGSTDGGTTWVSKPNGLHYYSIGTDNEGLMSFAVFEGAVISVGDLLRIRAVSTTSGVMIQPPASIVAANGDTVDGFATKFIINLII